MAYNYSIYMMVGTPYLLLGAFFFAVYRGMHAKSATTQQTAGTQLQAGDGGLSPCPPPSPDDVS